VDDQRHLGQGFDRADAGLVQPAFLVLLQMHIADRDRHRVDTAVHGQTRGFLRIGAGGILAAGIADKADLPLAGNACGLWAISAICAVSAMFWSSGLREPSNISEVKPAVERFLAFLERVAVIEMGHDRDGRILGQMPEHLAQDGNGVCARQDGPACRITGRLSASAAAT
jgi:hypothetical protein